jgi:hypothetical protein
MNSGTAQDKYLTPAFLRLLVNQGSAPVKLKTATELHKTDHLVLSISNSLPIRATRLLSSIVVSFLRTAMELHETNHLLFSIINSLPIRATLMLSADLTSSFRMAMEFRPTNHLASKLTQL